LENSLDACEVHGILPEVYIRISHESGPPEATAVYRVRVEDNGSGLPGDVIPSAFGQVLFGSKYKLRQTRGTFGLGGKMAILYGQITTHGEAYVRSSTGGKIWEYQLMIDIQNNKPIILKQKSSPNRERWRGTVIEFSTEGDYTRARAKILEYVKQTAIVVPYANLTFVDPKGRLYRFERAAAKMPKPPTETLPHPHGVDVETLKRIIAETKARNLLDFMRNHFQRIGPTTAEKFLSFALLNPKKNPRHMTPEELVKMVNALKAFEGFIAPDSTCLSPLGEELLQTGIRKELNPEFVAVHQRKPKAYSGFPFIVEVGVAYGGAIPQTGSILLFRFANKIPLLFDESSDVSWKVVNELMDWRHYKVAPEIPIAVFVHICSTKIPYKTVGKEFIADRPEVEHEILNGLREVARRLSLYLSRKLHLERDKRRMNIFSKYLPKIAKFSTDLSGRKKVPDVRHLLRGVVGEGESIELSSEEEGTSTQ